MVAPTLLLPTEDIWETKNSNAVRRIQLSSSKLVKWETIEGINRSIALSGTNQSGHSGVMMPHLMDFYESATVRRSEEKYAHAFSENMGLTNVIQQFLNTGDALPIKHSPRRVPMTLTGKEKSAIQEMEAQGVLKRSSSLWASPIILVRKNSGNMKERVSKLTYPTLQRCLRMLYTMNGNIKH